MFDTLVESPYSDDKDEFCGYSVANIAKPYLQAINATDEDYEFNTSDAYDRNAEWAAVFVIYCSYDDKWAVLVNPYLAAIWFDPNNIERLAKACCGNEFDYDLEQHRWDCASHSNVFEGTLAEAEHFVSNSILAAMRKKADAYMADLSVGTGC